MKIIPSLFLILLLTHSLAQEDIPKPEEPEKKLPFYYGSGVKALTGDTFEFDQGDSDASTRVIVRLAGVKAPKKGEPYFEQARAHLNNMITYKFFKIEVFEEIKGNGIEIRDVIIGLVMCLDMGPTHGSYLNQLALDEGIVKHNPEESMRLDQRMHDAFAEDQKAAEEAKKGMFAPDADKEKVPDLTKNHGFARFADEIQTKTRYTKLEEVDSGPKGKPAEPVEIDMEEFIKNIDL